jgi:hypothetical protein
LVRRERYTFYHTFFVFAIGFCNFSKNFFRFFRFFARIHILIPFSLIIYGKATSNFALNSLTKRNESDIIEK